MDEFTYVDCEDCELETIDMLLRKLHAQETVAASLMNESKDDDEIRSFGAVAQARRIEAAPLELRICILVRRNLVRCRGCHLIPGT